VQLRGIAGALCCLAVAVPSSADPIACDWTGYRASSGLTAGLADQALVVTWSGDHDRQLRLRLAVDDGVPVVRELAVMPRGEAWRIVAFDAWPEFRVTTGLRRISNQQLQPLRQMGVEITSEVVDRHKWDAFWDAPLDLTSPGGTGGNPPPAAGVAHQAGLPRHPSEVRHDEARFTVTGCTVVTTGGRLEVAFPGLQLGVFAGRLQFTVYRGTGLIRMEAIARTEEPSVAYKYEAGLGGLRYRRDPAAGPGGPADRLAWRDLGGQVRYDVLDARPRAAVVKSASRLIAAEHYQGSIAVFPPPHTFFWAREVETNLGYSWYRADGSSYALGIRQADREEEERYQANFSLYSAPPGTWQRMPVYFYVDAGPALSALDQALAFTRGDKYKALPGYQVMASHFHVDLGQRLIESGSLDTKLPDLEALRAAGINIVSPTDRPNGADRLEVLAASFEGARRHSTSDFLILAAEEVSALLGGHWDLVFPKPVFWTRERAAGQPFVDKHPVHGRLYRASTADEVMEMVRREGGLIFMPHPRTKGSTGYPDVIKDTAHFRDERYRGVGWRWGMGLDLSERRLSDGRVLALFDDMNNWAAASGGPLKFIQAITETYRKQPGDDIYANNPVNYIRLAKLPTPADASAVTTALMRGEYFVTSGEILIPSFAVTGTGPRRTITADVEWTFPLEFVEVVWGDGQRTDRQIVPATEFAPFGSHRFEIPFDATGKVWVRFAAWDSAGNGALVQPVRLDPAQAAAAAPASPRVAFDARALQPGELALATVTLPPDVTGVSLQVFGKDIPAARIAANTWQALIGIDLDVKPGAHEVLVRGKGGSDAVLVKERLTVTAKAFPTRRLTVAPDFVNPPPAEQQRIERDAVFLADVYARSASERLWTAAFIRPVPHPANSQFGSRSIFNGEARSPHGGTDFLSPAGTPVHAPNAGRVLAARDLYFTGNTVIIDHGLGVFSTFAHLSRLDVREGDTVAPGRLLGLVGATGRVTGPHLHWGLRVNDARVDPLSLLAVLGAAPGR
jgi:murein DD-endopeptidase MepM/ murein hydrolase activator NlpD